MAMVVTGDTELKGWYDGQKITFVSDSEKVWARVNGAATIDETLDRLAERLGMPMPVADFLYRSPFDALIGPESTGGYLGRETVNGVPCVRVAYQHSGADWDLWIAESGDPLPRQFHFTDKTRTPARTVAVVFERWSLGAPADDSAFVAAVPAGYERIPLAVQDEIAPDSAAPAKP
jgi:hypothetical protein